MKNVQKVIIVFTLILLGNNVFGGGAGDPFQVTRTGHGKRNLVFIPGFACSGKVWDETLAVFEPEFTCYTFTMPGFAGAPPEAAPSFAHWELGIADYVKQHHIDKPVIVGHSMGGGLALAIAADYPDLVSAIVVVDALPCLPAMRNPNFSSNPTNDCSSIVRHFTAISDSAFEAMQRTTMSSLVADTSRIGILVNWSVRSDRRTFATMYCDFMNTDLREKIKGINCPALILLEAAFVGMETPIADQYKNLSAARLSYATKGLHFIMFDDKDWYLQQLKVFIK